MISQTMGEQPIVMSKAIATGPAHKRNSKANDPTYMYGRGTVCDDYSMNSFGSI